jgi:hypothetical protein
MVQRIAVGVVGVLIVVLLGVIGFMLRTPGVPSQSVVTVTVPVAMVTTQIAVASVDVPTRTALPLPVANVTPVASGAPVMAVERGSPVVAVESDTPVAVASDTPVAVASASTRTAMHYTAEPATVTAQAVMLEHLIASLTQTPSTTMCRQQIVQVSQTKTVEISIDEPSTFWYIGSRENTVYIVSALIPRIPIYNYIAYVVIQDLARSANKSYQFEPGTYTISTNVPAVLDATILICPPVK